MNREQKAVVIEEIVTNIQDSQAIFAVDFRGITVPQAAELRDKLRAVDASFRVVKNSLTERAADQSGVVQLKGLLAGPTALTFVRGDAATAAKAIADYARLTQRLAFKGGVMDGIALSPEQVSAISRLLSRQALYGQLVGLVASPISGLVRTLNALLGGLAIQLGAILEKKQSGEIPAAEPPPAAAEPASEPAAEPPPAAAEPASEPAAEPPPAAAEPASEPAAEPPPAAAEPASEPAAERPAAEAQAAPAPAVDQPTAAASAPPLDDAEARPDPPPLPPASESSGAAEPPTPVADPPVVEASHSAESAAPQERSQAATPTPDSGDEVVAATVAKADEAQAETAPAAAAPATEEPTSDKENH